jgi:hypothetical protein
LLPTAWEARFVNIVNNQATRANRKQTLKSYLNELNARVEEQRAREALVKQGEAAPARDRRTLLDDRLKHLLSTIPPEVQAEGLSIVAVQVMLRPRGSERSCCTAGQLADALRRLGFVRERRWRDGRSSFRALWRKRQTGAPRLALIEDA